MPEYRCRIADWDREQDMLMYIRHRVFVQEQGVPPDLEADDFDAVATHFIVTTAADETAVATGRLKADGQIGRMAVLADHRGRGAGSLLLNTMMHYADERGMTGLYLHAQVDAIGFYERYGFEARGERFSDAGIEHRAMTRKYATKQL